MPSVTQNIPKVIPQTQEQKKDIPGSIEDELKTFKFKKHTDIKHIEHPPISVN